MPVVVDAQAFNDERVARYATPDDYQEVICGRAFARNRLMRCPVCGSSFYGYQAQDNLQAPHGQDPQPNTSSGIPVSGVRRTCGHPNCEAVEDREQYQKRKGGYGGEPEFAPNVQPSKPRPMLQKAGELGGLR